MQPFIDSPTNPTVKALRELAGVKQRKQAGQFVVEGVRIIQDALAAGFVPQSCLYSPDALKKTARGKEVLAALLRARHREARIYPATERAIAAASDTLHPQGIVASFLYPQWSVGSARTVAAQPEKPALALICDDIQDPGNLGTILRTAEGAGVCAVWLTPQCVDLYSPKVVRAAMGAHFRLPTFHERSWAQIAADLEELGVPLSAIYASEAGEQLSYDAVDWCRASALIVSNEARGLGEEARAFAAEGGGLISIPMLGGTESLNAAMAAAVILFEAARQRRAKDESAEC